MREIKFRAWDAKQSVMVYDGTMWLPRERWERRNEYRLSGVSVTSKGILWVRALKDSGPTVTVEIEGKTLRFYSGWDTECIEKDVELMQFTGRHDKNGVEIYEGDILSEPVSPVGGKDGGYLRMNRVIEWLGSESGYSLFAPEAASTIIGNIYEHPHLLSDGQ